jgi:hypothetical protein
VFRDVNGDFEEFPGDAIAVDNNNNTSSVHDLLGTLQLQGIFFVYDICNERSFSDISKWISKLEIFYRELLIYHLTVHQFILSMIQCIILKLPF